MFVSFIAGVLGLGCSGKCGSGISCELLRTPSITLNDLSDSVGMALVTKFRPAGFKGHFILGVDFPLIFIVPIQVHAYNRLGYTDLSRTLTLHAPQI